MSEFDATAEVERLKAQTKARRKRVYSRRISKLDAYKGELLSLHRAGASGAELQRWLKEKRITCALSTVLRYLQKNG
ncbi:MAG: hypothetical protein GY927_08140 [bacterium]|nr:hypothetical protein [bacterium]